MRSNRRPLHSSAMTRDYTKKEADERIAKLQERSNRRSDWADSRRTKADAAHQRSSDLVSGMPRGQPILSGHHSEKSHRNRIRRSQDALGRAVEHSDMAQHHQRIANRADAEIAEVRRRSEGPRFSKESGLAKGDRVAESAKAAAAGHISGVVVRANAKSCLLYTSPSPRDS